MIVSECGKCKRNTFYTFTKEKGCINEECEEISWEVLSYYKDNLKNILSKVLGFCGCGDPESTMVFIKKFLDLKQELHENIIKYDEYEKLRIMLFESHPQEIMWIIEYLLDDKRITTHGGNVSGSWIDDEAFKLTLDLYVRAIN
jgi:hypothetical protein